MKIKLVLMVMLMSIAGTLNSFAACNVKDVDGKWTSAELGFVVEDEDGNTIGGNVSSQSGSSSSSQETGAESYNDYAFKLGETYYIYLTVNGEKEVQYDDGSGSEYYCRLEIDTSVTGRDLKLKDPDTGDIAVLESDQIKGMNTDGEPCTISLDNIDPESDEPVPFLYEVVELDYELRTVWDGKDNRYVPTKRRGFLKGEQVYAFLLVNGMGRPAAGQDHYHYIQVATDTEGKDLYTGEVLRYGDLEINLDGEESELEANSIMMSMPQTRSKSGEGNSNLEALKYSVAKHMKVEKVTYTVETNLIKDDGGKYHDAQWLDTNLDDSKPDYADPITYQGGKAVTLKVDFDCDKVDFSGEGAVIKIQGEGAPKADGTYQIVIPPTDVSIKVEYEKGDSEKIKKSTLLLPVVTSKKVFEKKVDYIKDMSIKWQIKFDKQPWVAIESVSKNDAYITLEEEPLCEKHYRSLYHIACEQATGATSKSGAFEKLSKYLSNKSTVDYDGDKLCFYGITFTNMNKCDYTEPNKPSLARYISTLKGHKQTAQSLLLQHDGRCGEWVRLTQQLARVYGIKKEKNPVLIIAPDEAMIPKVDSTKVPAGYLPDNKPLLDVGTADGQNITSPLEHIWSNHSFVAYGENTFFDPSFGKDYPKLGNVGDSIVGYGWRYSKYDEEGNRISKKYIESLTAPSNPVAYLKLAKEY